MEIKENDGICHFVKTKNSFSLTHKSWSHPGLLQRINYFGQILQNIGIDTFSIKVCFHDSGRKLAEEHKEVYCFARPIGSQQKLIYNFDCFDGYLDETIKRVVNSNITPNTNGSIFAGSPTGFGDRQKYCQACDQKIHMGIIGNQIPLSLQLLYKFLINIDGNSVCYSRLYWQIASNSVPIYINKGQEEDFLLSKMPNGNYYSYDMEDWFKEDLSSIDCESVKNKNIEFFENYLKNTRESAIKHLKEQLV